MPYFQDSQYRNWGLNKKKKKKLSKDKHSKYIIQTIGLGFKKFTIIIPPTFENAC